MSRESSTGIERRVRGLKTGLECLMFKRRDFLRDVTLGIAAWGTGGGRACAQPAEDPPARPAPTAGGASPVRADEAINRRLAPIRERHHLPGLMAGVVRGETLE